MQEVMQPTGEIFVNTAKEFANILDDRLAERTI